MLARQPPLDGSNWLRPCVVIGEDLEVIELRRRDVEAGQAIVVSQEPSGVVDGFEEASS